MNHINWLNSTNTDYSRGWIAIQADGNCTDAQAPKFTLYYLLSFFKMYIFKIIIIIIYIFKNMSENKISTK